MSDEDKENKTRKQRGKDKIHRKEAKAHVFDIVYKYQTAIMRGERSWT